jgi:uncharacterized protein YbjQ (UPF0145 family)
MSTNDVIVVTSNEVPGHEVTDVYGDIVGVVVRARDYFSNLGARLKTVIGGEVDAYTTMMLDAREEARLRLADAAGAIGANAVVAVRYSVSEIGGIMQEVAAYGTAVRIMPAIGLQGEIRAPVALHWPKFSNPDGRYGDLPEEQARSMRDIDARRRRGELDVAAAREERSEVKVAVEVQANLDVDKLATRTGVRQELDRIATAYKAGELTIFQHRRLKSHLTGLLDTLHQ